jgi:hypothetical protein
VAVSHNKWFQPGRASRPPDRSHHTEAASAASSPIANVSIQSDKQKLRTLGAQF